MAEDIKQIREALHHVCKSFLKKQNVIATGIGYKNLAGKDLSIVCSVERKLPLSQLSNRDLVPKTIDGIQTDVIETGRIHTFNAHLSRHRPAPGGVSIGHRDITAGTLGCIVKKDGKRVILSNNHVLANSNDAAIGDAILQPGPADGGKYPDDHIANLLEFIPISMLDGGTGGSNCPIANGFASVLNLFAAATGSATRLRPVKIQATDNLVDAAIALPLNDADVLDDIMDIGAIAGLKPAELNMEVQKSGRTTQYTSGVIQQIDVTVDVSYGAGQTARFTDQLLTGPISQGGDSGSAVLDKDKNLVGLLFAGSNSSTIVNRIENVFSALGLSL
ncbi:MAG: S1 family peptidase [Gammaproteobacteria bacterium]|nr:S1 family peptidase [Gammaproteobacteria bacterium]MDH5651116.1 S1 family peptidase [Gammaproteobacteria bacterium]